MCDYVLQLSSKKTEPASNKPSTDGLISSMEHFSLDSGGLPPYESLSYAWAGYQPHMPAPKDAESEAGKATFIYSDADKLDQTLLIDGMRLSDDGRGSFVPPPKTSTIEGPEPEQVHDERHKLWNTEKSRHHFAGNETTISTFSAHSRRIPDEEDDISIDAHVPPSNPLPQEHSSKIFKILPVRVMDPHFVEISTSSLALVSNYARTGDSIIILHGCPTPVVLRKVEDNNGKGITYNFVGCCYLENAILGRKSLGRKTKLKHFSWRRKISTAF